MVNMAHLNHVPGLHFPGVFRDSRNRFPVEGGKAEVRQSVCQEPGQLSVICSFVQRGVGGTFSCVLLGCGGDFTSRWQSMKNYTRTKHLSMAPKWFGSYCDVQLLFLQACFGHWCLNLKYPSKAHVLNTCSSIMILFWQAAGPLGGGPCLQKRVPWRQDFEAQTQPWLPVWICRVYRDGNGCHLLLTRAVRMLRPNTWAEQLCVGDF